MVLIRRKSKKTLAREGEEDRNKEDREKDGRKEIGAKGT